MDTPTRFQKEGWPRGYLSQEVVRERWSELGGSSRIIGTSVEQRPIEAWEWNLTGSNASEPDRSNGILILALLHPMEWVGQLAALALVESLVQGSVRIPYPARLRVLPVANPDGVASVERSLRSRRARWIRGNAHGVDLNRNFSIAHRCRPRWMDAFPMWCPGPGPASEPETRAIEAWARAEPFDIAISFHSFGRWIFHPPAYTRTKDAVSHRHLGALQAAERRLAQSWSPYRTTAVGRWSWWFRAYGAEIDFLASLPRVGSLRSSRSSGRETDHGSLAYLIEVSRGGIFRWGAQRAFHPFYWFNPPDPENELTSLAPCLHALVESALGD